MREIGTEYLVALEAAQAAWRVFKTNDDDRYDPCGDTERRVTAEYEAALVRLAKATKALVEAVG